MCYVRDRCRESPQKRVLLLWEEAYVRHCIKPRSKAPLPLEKPNDELSVIIYSEDYI